jgi:aminopeptidase
MTEADQVEITGPGTDLRFSMKGIKAIGCGGTHNIPDGEVFSCPVKDSVEGHVTYNADTIYQGTSFSGIKLSFKEGKIMRQPLPPMRKSSTRSSIPTMGQDTLGNLPSGLIP